MKKVTLLGSTLALVLSSSTATAADFHALTAVKSAPAPIQDKALSAIEGGASCHFQTAGSVSGLTVCDIVAMWPLIIATPAASFTAANELSITNAQFLQVTE